MIPSKVIPQTSPHLLHHLNLSLQVVNLSEPQPDFRTILNCNVVNFFNLSLQVVNLSEPQPDFRTILNCNVVNFFCF